MKLLAILILLQFTLSHSLPSRIQSFDSEKPWIRRIRSNTAIPSPPKRGRIVKVLGYPIRVPRFVDTAAASIKDFFVGPSGIVTKTKDFLQGNTKVSANFFGHKIEFQANVPLSVEEIRETLSSFLKKLRTDPMTRVLLAMYLNVVIVIVVYMALLAKHTQISLKKMRLSRQKNGLPSPATASAKSRRKSRKSPMTPLRHRNTSQQRFSPELDAGSEPETNESPEAEPSLLGAAEREPKLDAEQPKRRLLNDLSGILSESSTQCSESSYGDTKPTSSREPKSEIKSPLERRQSSLRNSKYSSAPSAQESTASSFDTSQYIPTLNKDSAEQ
ncbi:hypothetical protein GCK32_000988 [Trichostrongylus colubriformis]|uniref:Uncharacterized protein n=1 Tax=Trichostrongylus colubriformis TaxID=6319 RepID=A0AAN8F9W6_TRICO